MVWGAGAAFRAWRSSVPAALAAVSAAPPRASLEADRLVDLPRTRERFEFARAHASEFDPHANPRLVEWLTVGDAAPRAEPDGWPEDALRIEYSLDETLTADVFEVLRRGRVERGHAVQALRRAPANPEPLLTGRTGASAGQSSPRGARPRRSTSCAASCSPSASSASARSPRSPRRR